MLDPPGGTPTPCCRHPPNSRDSQIPAAPGLPCLGHAPLLLLAPASRPREGTHGDPGGEEQRIQPLQGRAPLILAPDQPLHPHRRATGERVLRKFFRHSLLEIPERLERAGHSSPRSDSHALQPRWVLESVLQPLCDCGRVI